MKFHPRKGCFSWNKTPMTLEELLVEYDATMEDVYKFLSIRADEFDESYKEFFLDVMTGPGTLANEDLTSEKERKQRDKERKNTVSSQKISDRHTDISSGFRCLDKPEDSEEFYKIYSTIYKPYVKKTVPSIFSEDSDDESYNVMYKEYNKSLIYLELDELKNYLFTDDTKKKIIEISLKLKQLTLP